jgi:hypothetical protein
MGWLGHQREMASCRSKLWRVLPVEHVVTLAKHPSGIQYGRNRGTAKRMLETAEQAG